MPFFVGAAPAAVRRPEHSGWKSAALVGVPPVPVVSGVVVPPVPVLGSVVVPPVLVGGVVVVGVVPPVLVTPPVPSVVAGELPPPHPWAIRICARSATAPT
jgi:hypothetical protein